MEREIYWFIDARAIESTCVANLFELGHQSISSRSARTFTIDPTQTMTGDHNLPTKWNLIEEPSPICWLGVCLGAIHRALPKVYIDGFNELFRSTVALSADFGIKLPEIHCQMTVSYRTLRFGGRRSLDFSVEPQFHHKRQQDYNYVLKGPLTGGKTEGKFFRTNFIFRSQQTPANTSASTGSKITNTEYSLRFARLYNWGIDRVANERNAV